MSARRQTAALALCVLSLSACLKDFPETDATDGAAAEAAPDGAEDTGAGDATDAPTASDAMDEGARDAASDASDAGDSSAGDAAHGDASDGGDASDASDASDATSLGDATDAGEGGANDAAKEGDGDAAAEAAVEAGTLVTGSPCGQDADCASTVCSEGVCCDTECGACHSCRQSNTGKADGTCALTLPGKDPKGDCKDEGATTCKQDGQCDGAGSCRLYAVGTPCGTASCANFAVAVTPLCTGTGMCAAAASPCTDQTCKGGACTGVCSQGQKRCGGTSGALPQTCTPDGQWQDGAACNDYQTCVAGNCQDCPQGAIGPLHACNNACTSIASDASNCGTCGKTCAAGSICSAASCLDTGGGLSCLVLASNQSCGDGGSGSASCCESEGVTGGTFARGYDGVSTGYTDASNTASVSAFVLNKYEVTVGRFRAFIDEWVNGWRPGDGNGKHAHLRGGLGLAKTDGGYEPGWTSSWANSFAPTRQDWATASYLGCDAAKTYTDLAGANEDLPLTCASWFEAYAFCIWDGGFLPTEAEWEYAAANGSDQRVYPWSNPAASATIDCLHAKYGACMLTGPASVGTLSPKGNGFFGQADLAGNVAEWTLDSFQVAYANPCVDCVALPKASAYKVVHGGSWQDADSAMLVGARASRDPGARSGTVGFRCARSP